MKTTTNNLIKSALVVFFLLFTSTAFSATYYMCTGATLALNPAATAGVTYSWDVIDASTNNSVTGFPRAAAPTTLPGAGTYTVKLISTPISAADCAPDVVENTIIVLPSLTTALGAPTVPSYCETAATKSSQVVSSTTGFNAAANYATDLELVYSYAVTKGGSTVDPTTVGTVDATGKYTLTTGDIGTYVITSTVKYKEKTVTGKLLGTTGCLASSTTQTVTVTAKPSAPSITISAN